MLRIHYMPRAGRLGRLLAGLCLKRSYELGLLSGTIRSLAGARVHYQSFTSN